MMEFVVTRWLREGKALLIRCHTLATRGKGYSYTYHAELYGRLLELKLISELDARWRLSSELYARWRLDAELYARWRMTC